MDNQGPYSTLERYYEETPPGLEYNQPALEVPQPGLESSDKGPEVATDPELRLGNDSKKNGLNRGTVCGLTRKTFVIVVILAIFIIIGGVLGGTLRTRKKAENAELKQNPPLLADPVLPVPTNSSTPSSTNLTTPNFSTSALTNISKSTLLENSSIAAVNWTDINDIQYHGVFHQNKTNSILLSLWDSQSKKWSLYPVSIAGNKQPEPVLPGTAISAMVPRMDSCTSNATQANSFAVKFQLSVYVYSTNNNIMEFFTTDPQAGPWQVGGLTGKRLNGNPASQLAAAWQRCCSPESWCLNNVAIMYQHPSQKLKTIGFTSGKGWSEIPVDVSSTVVAPGTAMAMIPLADKRTGKVPLLLKGYVESNQVTQEFSWEWSYWRTGTTFDDPREEISQLAAIPLYTSELGLAQIYVAKLHLDGSISSKWRDDERWEDLPAPNMDKPQANFTAIAMNYDRRAYGVSLGQIHEYEISNEDPTNWIYIGTVDV